MRVLSIGNSFSQDAHHYLRPLFLHNGARLKAVNLMIGGCSLETHYINMLDNLNAYHFEYNAEGLGLKVSLRQALISDDWDVITLQQASNYSGKYSTYTPYIEELAAYIRKYRPHARLVIHETWSYEDKSVRLSKTAYETADDMIAAVRASYEKAAEAIGADGIIRAGEAMRRAEAMGLCVHRDSSHAALGVGRYILALSWYRALTGGEIDNDTFSAFDVPVSEEERAIAIAAVKEVIPASIF